MQTVSGIIIRRKGWLKSSFIRISTILPIFLSLWSINVAAKALIVVEASVVLEGGPSKRQHLQEVGHEDSELGAKDNQRCVVGGHRRSGISAANVPLFAASVVST